MNSKTITTVSMLLAGSFVLAACGSGGGQETARQPAAEGATSADAAHVVEQDAMAGGDDALEAPAAPKLEYAEVLAAKPVTEKQRQYATVTGIEPVSETSTTTTPRQVCEDVVVQERLPERDGNVGGTVAGAVIGGIVGSNVGSGSGRRAATAAGAVAGGIIGNKVDKKYERGQVVDRVETQCHTVQETSESSRVVGYKVNYRNPDGTTGTMRMDSKPGERIQLGSKDVTVGYDVTFRYNGVEKTVRMDEDPGDRLPVLDGNVVLQSAAVEGGSRG